MKKAGDDFRAVFARMADEAVMCFAHANRSA